MGKYKSKMTAEEIEFLATAIDFIGPYGIKKIEVVMKDSSYGERAARIFQVRYDGRILNIGGWKEFDVKFASKSKMEEALGDITASLADWWYEYQQNHTQEYIEHGYPDPSDSDINSDSSDDPDKKGLDLTTYIIIGAAVAAIIILLWPTKRK